MFSLTGPGSGLGRKWKDTGIRESPDPEQRAKGSARSSSSSAVISSKKKENGGGGGSWIPNWPRIEVTLTALT